jgi:hypothetical protein
MPDGSLTVLNGRQTHVEGPHTIVSLQKPIQTYLCQPLKIDAFHVHWNGRLRERAYIMYESLIQPIEDVIEVCADSNKADMLQMYHRGWWNKSGLGFSLIHIEKA